MTQMRLKLVVSHIHANLAKDVGDNLDKFVNFISRNQWTISTFAIIEVTDN